MSLHHHHTSGAGHSHGHARSHGHSHDHVQPPASFNRAFALGIILNTGFVAVEAVYGILSGSMALVADAGHNLSDVLGLIIAWGAMALSARPASARYTYGFKSSSILAALGNAALLLAAVGAIFVETIRRLIHPAPVDGGPVMAVAAIGIVVNVATALLFLRGRKHDINIRGAYLHMVADAAVSAGVVIAGLLIALTGRIWIDPVTSLIIVAVITHGTWSLLKSALRMSLLGVPESVDERKVRNFLMSLPGVTSVHDLHIWPMSTTETALTAHLVMPGGHPGDPFLHELAHELDHDFGIQHTTIQVEVASGAECAVDCHSHV